MDMYRQGLALSIEFLNQGGVAFLYNLVEPFSTHTCPITTWLTLFYNAGRKPAMYPEMQAYIHGEFQKYQYQ